MVTCPYFLSSRSCSRSANCDLFPNLNILSSFEHLHFCSRSSNWISPLQTRGQLFSSSNSISRIPIALQSRVWRVMITKIVNKATAPILYVMVILPVTDALIFYYLRLFVTNWLMKTSSQSLHIKRYHDWFWLVHQFFRCCDWLHVLFWHSIPQKMWW